jgi:glycosyltransferase involved in cell wall biosynthesis
VVSLLNRVQKAIKKMIQTSRPLRIFTWHIHGSYLYYLSQGNFDIFIPFNDNRSEGYVGRGNTFPFGQNVIEVPASEVKHLELDCILFQTARNYQKDQFELLSERQRQLPRLYLEHDPPQEVPTNTRHVVDDATVHIVHVTDFNCLMWDNNDSPTHVIDHGIAISEATYEGTIPKGLVIINNIHERGRRLGLDVFLDVRKHVPLDIIGMNTEKVGGLGEILHPQLPDFIKQYRFFFNPIRYTSLGLAVLEAMMVGMPVVGLATTEMVTVIRDGENGVLHTNIPYLVRAMHRLIQDPEWAARLGRAGRETAIHRFNIFRFIRDWENLFHEVIDREQNTSRADRKSLTMSYE